MGLTTLSETEDSDTSSITMPVTIREPSGTTTRDPTTGRGMPSGTL
jgi:hypothetical protein